MPIYGPRPARSAAVEPAIAIAAKLARGGAPPLDGFIAPAIAGAIGGQRGAARQE